MTADGENLHKPFLLLIALLQGITLLLLHKAGEFHSWPNGEPQWNTGLYTLAITGPVLLLLSHDRRNRCVITGLVGAFTLVVALLGYYPAPFLVGFSYWR